ncbi:Rha family transcriptional regulator [Azospirillum baldaniorum]|uniref:Rha family transcriptional regulator n=1 Tax=Azospirillum baldaniorum TaxID=1064539 RepID=UPI00157AC283|nr:Rha family transcriptional regulator [Azospirillum baldaniorum]
MSFANFSVAAASRERSPCVPDGPTAATLETTIMSFKGNMPLVFERNGVVMTSTKGVAEGFSKPHADVLKAARELIRKLEQSQPEFAAQNFFPVKNKGLDGAEFMEEVNLTRDGFTLLAMGFTGARALEFKLRYIDAFNRMEAMLKSGGFDPATLESLVTKTVSAAMTAAMMGMKDMVAEVVEQTVEAKMAADPRAAVQEYIAPLTIAKKFGAPVRGRRRFTQGMGNRLAHICAQWEVPVKLCPVTGRRMFPSHVVDYWLEKEGRRVIAEHIARVSGQGVLPFRKSGRTSNP